MVDSTRYIGKPMLRLLECFVLDSIGCLSEQDKIILTAMEPKLSATFKTDGTWREIISNTMDWPLEMPSLIFEAYSKNKVIAENHNTTLDSQIFAEMFVDQNFI